MSIGGKCTKFQAGLRFSQEVDSCLKCGRTSSAHYPPETGITIVFKGKIWRFKNWEEAQKKGFYLVD